MSGDNRIFNVNGRLDSSGDKLLLETLKLAFAHASEHAKADGYRIDPKLGLIFHWASAEHADIVKFPSPLTAEQVFPVVLGWLQSNPVCECTSWDADADHDGHNGPGWRVYCRDWGHVGDPHGFIAVKPAFIWYGK